MTYKNGAQRTGEECAGEAGSDNSVVANDNLVPEYKKVNDPGRFAKDIEIKYFQWLHGLGACIVPLTSTEAIDRGADPNATLVPWTQFTTEPRPSWEQILAWTDDTNRFAMVCGDPSGGLGALDVDSFEAFGGIGLAVLTAHTWTEERLHGKLHISLRFPPGTKSETLRVGSDKPEIEIKANGSLITLGYSPHHKGGYYKRYMNAPNFILSIDKRIIDAIKTQYREFRGILKKKDKSYSYCKGFTPKTDILSLIKKLLHDNNEALEQLHDYVDYFGCRCPLPNHNDKRPSFLIYPKRNYFVCLGCGRGGNPVDFASYYLGISKDEAKRTLNKLGFIELTDHARNDTELPEEKPITGEITFSEFLNLYESYYYYTNVYEISIPIAFGISNFSTVDSGMLIIMGPSGSNKTEIIRMWGEVPNQYQFPIDNLTAHTFISGLVGAVDLASQLNRRLITCKDLTAILSKREDERASIMADFRAIIDGSLVRVFGSGKKVAYTDLHSSVLAASTSALESYHSLNSIMGQRQIFYRPRIMRLDSARQAAMNMDDKPAIREEMHITLMKLINHIYAKYRDILDSNLKSMIPNVLLDGLLLYSYFVACARTPVKKDFKGNISDSAEVESPTRLVIEIAKIIACHALLHDRTEVAYDDIRSGLIVLISTIPRDRLALLAQLVREDELFTNELGERAQLPPYAVKSRLDELFIVGMLTRNFFDGSGYQWHLKKEFKYIGENLFDLHPFPKDISVDEGGDRGVSSHVGISDPFFDRVLKGYNISFNDMEIKLKNESDDLFCFNLFVEGRNTTLSGNIVKESEKGEAPIPTPPETLPAPPSGLIDDEDISPSETPPSVANTPEAAEGEEVIEDGLWGFDQDAPPPCTNCGKVTVTYPYNGGFYCRECMAVAYEAEEFDEGFCQTASTESEEEPAKGLYACICGFTSSDAKAFRQHAANCNEYQAAQTREAASRRRRELGGADETSLAGGASL